MCGIAAVFAYGAAASPVDREEVRRMRERMFSRGPDGSGEWFSDDGRVGIGHRRLSIIDLSPAGDQPMFNADRSLAITFNGEIYNYVELARPIGGERISIPVPLRHRSHPRLVHYIRHRRDDEPPARNVRVRDLGSEKTGAAAGARPVRNKASLLF